MAALAAPFTPGDPMRLAGKLARRSGLAGGDDIDTNIQAMVGEAAACMAAGEIAAAERTARQTTPPAAWIRTAGPTIAARLDHIATLRASAAAAATRPTATLAHVRTDPTSTTDEARVVQPAPSDPGAIIATARPASSRTR